MNERCNNAIRWINEINWNKLEYTNRKSDLVLAKEFIRRSAMFFIDISQDSKTAFFSAANILNKDFTINIEEICPKVMELSFYNKLACKHYIEWAYLADKGEALALKYENLYEPLIRLLERGTIIKMHHREFEVGENNFIYLEPGICSYASEIPIDITNIALEKYDNQ